MLPYAQLHYKIVSHRFTSLDLEPIHATPRRQFWGHRASTMNIFHGTFVCIFFKQREWKAEEKFKKSRLHSINVVRINFFFFCELSSIPSCLLFQFDGVNLNRYINIKVKVSIYPIGDKDLNLVVLVPEFKSVVSLIS